jgi:hypothetical protein
MIESLGWVLRMMRYYGLANSADYSTIKSGLLSAAEGYWHSYQYSGNGQNANLRAVAYFAGVSGQKYQGTTNLVVTAPPGSPFALKQAATDFFSIVDARQLNADGFANMSLCYGLTGDSTWKDRFFEMLNSCFADQADQPTNKYSSLWYFNQIQRNWNQHYRQGLKATGWLSAGIDL